MVGCSGHNDPVRSDQSGVLYRSAQAFSEPEEWGDACTLDSSTSTWTVTGGTIGDIATDDGDIDLPFTAFVRTKPIMGGTVVGLVLLNGNWESVYEGDFYYQQGYQHCVHPAVEVTYSHPEQSDPQLTVHIIWAQEFPNQWDIVYGQLQFDPTEEPPWEPAYESGLVTDTGSCYETQPDLAVYYPDGDLYAVCRAEVPGPTRYAIYAYKLPYDDGWDPDGWVSAGPVALLNTTPKEHPSIDAGLSSRVSGGEPMQLVQVVWSQPVNGEYNIFYNYWEIANYAHPPYNIRISPQGPAIVPKIEVLPYSSGLNEAVITWGADCFGGLCPYRKKVWMAVTPFIGEEYQYSAYEIESAVHSESHGPDLAPYQGEHYEGEGLIALSYYNFYVDEEANEHWEIKAPTYKVWVNYGETTFGFDWEQDTYLERVFEWDPYWPFMGPSICLRNPDPSGWQYDTFGMAFIEEGYTAYLAEGDTT